MLCSVVTQSVQEKHISGTMGCIAVGKKVKVLVEVIILLWEVINLCCGDNLAPQLFFSPMWPCA